MFAYYLRLAFISIRKNLVTSTLMVAAVALGIGTCMTMVTVNYLMGSNPMAHKGDSLFYVQVDNWDPNQAYDEPDEPPELMTYIDAMALMKASGAPRQTVNGRVGLVLEPDDPEQKPSLVSGRANYGDFFTMFDVPFQYGSGWDRRADEAHDQVVVLTRALNDQVFGGANSVGKTVRLSGRLYRVVGVADTWVPIPKFYDLSSGSFNPGEDLFIPFSLIAALDLSRTGNTNCWKPIDGEGLSAFLNSDCVWTQYWVELPSAQEQQAFRTLLDNYVTDQKVLGRFPRPLNNRIANVGEWLAINETVAPEARMMLVVGVMFLAVCLLNTVGLLLSKFFAKAGEIGIRRALGGSQRALFSQYLVESACIGVLGGALGLVLSWSFLQGVKVLFGQEMEPLVNLDATMVATAIALAVLSSVAAGLYPTWRACRISPASQLKSQ